MKKRVVITGMGTINPIGNNINDSWKGIISGKSGIAPIKAYNADNLPVRFCGEVKNFDPSSLFSTKDARKMDLFIQYALYAAEEAINDAKLKITPENSENISVLVGAGVGGLPGITEGYGTLLEKGAKRVSPFYVPRSIINMAAGHISMRFGIKGPSLSTVTACTSGTHSIGQAFRMIQYGETDIAITGGAEMSSCPMGIAGFAAAKALSTNNDNPEKASRPWDIDRDGFVLADGAGILVIESLESAEKREANIYAEIVGFGMSSDAYHITVPPEDGDGARRCMLNTVKDAGIKPSSIKYLNAHGTSTPLGDKAEYNAVKSVFKDCLDNLKMSSTKSMTGHMLGAAGAVEAIFTILSIRDSIVPPTINLDNPEFTDIDLVTHKAKETNIDYALSNSFGFGGTNGSLLFKKYKD